MTEKFIVRGKDSGVYFGEIENRNGREVTMRNARNIWYWEGAAGVMQLAKDGVANPENCKFTVYVDKLELLDSVEIIPCTAKAIESIEGVPEWTI